MIVSFSRYYFVHSYVVLLTLNAFHELEIEADANLVGTAELWQQSIVVALAASHAVELAVESNARDYGEVNLCIVAEHFAHGFHDVVSALFEALRTGVAAQFHCFLACYARQQYALAACQQRIDERMCVHLVGQRVVEHYGASILQSLVCEQTHNYNKRQFAELLARELSFAVLYLLAEF